MESLEEYLAKPRKLNMNGGQYYIRLRITNLDKLNPQDSSTMQRAWKEYRESSRRVDGAIFLYDVTRKESLDAVPLCIRALNQGGKPCMMVSTKGDCSLALRQLDPDAVEQKTKMVVRHLKAARSSIKSGVPQRCLESLMHDILEASVAATSSPSRPRTQSSCPSSSEVAKRSRPMSVLSPDSKNDHAVPAEVPSFWRSHSPLPQYLALAVNTTPASLRLSHRTSQGSEPFSPRTFAEADDSSASDQASTGSQEILNPAAMKTLPSHIMEIVTFEELVARVCFRDNQKADVRFDFNFLVFYRFFASPLRLLTALISVYTSTARAEANSDIANRVLQFLSQWVTIHPGDFAGEETYRSLEDFLGTFDQSSTFFPVKEQIRMASGKIDEDDDKIWSLPDAVDVNGNAESQGLEKVRSAETDASASDLDATLIFRTHSTLTLEAVGPSHAPTNSVDQSTIPYHMTSSAQRQSSMLKPSSSLPFTKNQWRQLMAQPEESIARELTRIDWIMFSAIQPRDMIRHITVPTKERSRFRELENVTRMVEHFNHIAYWTTNLILLRDKPKHRALALEKLILVARKLRELNNYNCLGAIVAGIHCTAIHRLAATREIVPAEVQKNFLKLEVLMSAQRGHASYRLAWENTTGPRIPFLPLHRRDLVMAEEGNKTWVTVDESEDAQDRRINWNKFHVLGGMLWDLHEAQSMPYDCCTVNEQIRSLVLDGSIVKDDDELYDRSVAIETAGSATSSATMAMRRLQTSLARYGFSDPRAQPL